MQQALNLPLAEHGKQIVLKKYKHELRTPPELLSIFLGDRLPDELNANVKWIDSSNIHAIPLSNGRMSCVANHCPMNDYGKINSFLSAVNRRLSVGDYYITCVEPLHLRNEFRYNGYSRWFRELMSLKDFIIHRVIPRTKLPGKLYFRITKGKGRVLSLSESLARICYNGFSIEDHVRIKDKIWIFAKKTGQPVEEKTDQRMLLRLRRVGYRGKKVKIYKLRTMHPYSQYLQGYVYNQNDLDNNGKFKNDFRTTSWGAFLRKYWLDEFPMFINLLKGELKLVGVRPLSEHYFKLYPEDLQNLRTRVKPGLVPPYYADMPNGLEEIQESERRYLEAFQKAPIKTDIIYFFSVFYNIFFKGARSQ